MGDPAVLAVDSGIGFGGRLASTRPFGAHRISCRRLRSTGAPNAAQACDVPAVRHYSERLEDYAVPAPSGFMVARIAFWRSSAEPMNVSGQ